MRSVTDQLIKIVLLFLVLATYSRLSQSESQLINKDLGSYHLSHHHCTASRSTTQTQDAYHTSYPQMLMSSSQTAEYRIFEGYRLEKYVYGETAVFIHNLFSGFLYSEENVTPYVFGYKVANSRLVAYDTTGNHYDLLIDQVNQHEDDCVDLRNH